jgi:lipopolysaccharide/colanic/teichoic acid biosynthesis glycosyltransferase
VASPFVAELNGVAVAPAQEDQVRLRPWQAVAQAKGRPGYFLAKRCLDCAIAGIALVVLAPVLLVTALLVRLTSPGPVIFRQERVSFRGRHFTMYKFRSMYVNSDERLHQLAYEQFLRGERSNGKVDGTLVADGERGEDARQDTATPASVACKPRRARVARDPRVTPLGHLLRQCSIDELPQFFNVLRGDMSLVGPRPPIPYEVSLYDSWHLRRLDTLPGITGIWQVRGRSRVSFEEMVQMDLEYIQKQSFWYDVKLLFLTIPAVLSRKGAE